MLSGGMEMTGVLSRPTSPVWKRAARSPWTVAVLVLLVNGLWMAQLFAMHRHDARYFIYMGQKFSQQSHTSAAIAWVPGLRTERTQLGFDGQFYYFIAVDPVHARDYMDQYGPAYRYTRVLYPLLARALALGRADLIPYTLVLINWLAIAAGTLIVALWLRRKRKSPWFALAYGLYPGLSFSLERDLTEPLAFALVALGMYAFEFAGKRRIIAASGCFALAVLARESVALFPVAYGLVLVADGFTGGKGEPRVRWRDGGVMIALSLLPLVMYKGFLLIWLGSLGSPADSTPRVIPFQGLFLHWPFDRFILLQIVAVVIPALICVGMGIWAIVRGERRVEVWVLLANVQVFVVMLNPLNFSAYEGSGRVAAGVVLAALFCLPAFDRLTGENRWWLWASCLCWLSYSLYFLSLVPVWLLVPLLYLVAMAALASRPDGGRFSLTPAALSRRQPHSSN